MKGIVHSPKEKIPLFKVVQSDDGVRNVEYRNDRTSLTEKIKASSLAIYLIEQEMARKTSEKTMVYSPAMKIPIGSLFYDDGRKASYIEVKRKKKKEPILFSTYVSLVLETEVLEPKAS